MYYHRPKSSETQGLLDTLEPDEYSKSMGPVEPMEPIEPMEPAPGQVTNVSLTATA